MSNRYCIVCDSRYVAPLAVLELDGPETNMIMECIILRLDHLKSEREKYREQRLHVLADHQSALIDRWEGLKKKTTIGC